MALAIRDRVAVHHALRRARSGFEASDSADEHKRLVRAIRELADAYAYGALVFRQLDHLLCAVANTSAYIRIRQHTSAHAVFRQSSAYVSIRQHTSAHAVFRRLDDLLCAVALLR